jgi:hypothetical protein
MESSDLREIATPGLAVRLLPNGLITLNQKQLFGYSSKIFSTVSGVSDSGWECQPLCDEK